MGEFMENFKFKFINMYVLPIINQASKDNKQRDILSFLFIVTTFLSGASLIYIAGSIDSVLGYIVPLISLIISIIITLGIFFKSNHVFIYKLIVLLLLSIFLIYFYKLEFLALLLIGFSIPLLFFYPIGKLGYYRVIQNLNYLEEIINLYNEKQAKKKKSQLIALFIVIVLAFILYYFALPHMIPFDNLLSSILFGAFILIMWLYQGSSNSELQLYKKSIVYLLFFAALVIANFKAKSNVLELPLLLFNIFFALDRIISLSKEVKELIVSKSILYYNDHDDIKVSHLISNLIPVQYIEKVELEEEDIVRQLIIRYRLSLEEEFFAVYNVYSKRDFKRYKQLVETYNYFWKYKESSLDKIDERCEEIKVITDYENQEIIMPEIYLEFARILFHCKRYEDSIEYFKQVNAYLNEEDRKLLEEASLNIDNNVEMED